jgi:predicted component of type VI protein secretion system
MEQHIQQLIRNYEPRIRPLEIRVTPDEDNNAMNVRIVFSTNLSQENQEVELTLYRVR